ncbi:D-cysteine desulfhydrase [Pelagibius litoralis]|uniref:D-cysteine desulfhydrase n=1 Tax=Pelagibius litoralis TaxID=374515 RepID=A0A967C2T8_9PROT|nr:D-cysteine desulfhydrase [Pelagibius litoralis]NIA67095.1 D-cysteine desulfhydrase [Pelagibius litoralis]
MSQTDRLQAALNACPRLPLAHLPTPLEPLQRLSTALDGPEILVKRDDCTGLGLGGNKTRKLEFLMAEARTQAADTIITTGGIQSNHVRQTAAAAAKLGLACELVLTRVVPWGGPDYELIGNIQLDRLFGAKTHLHDGDTDRGAAMAALAERLQAKGRKPFAIPTGGSNATGALGYAAAALELREQLQAQDRTITAVVHASSSGGTQAGLTAGLAAVDPSVQVIGIDVDAHPAAVEGEVRRLAREVWDRLEPGGQLPEDSVRLEPGYAGDAYGLPTTEMRDAISLCAKLEGLLLDPVYSGKAMAGLIGMIRAGRFSQDDTIVFLHTGGTPALFPYREALVDQ